MLLSLQPSTLEFDMSCHSSKQFNHADTGIAVSEEQESKQTPVLDIAGQRTCLQRNCYPSPLNYYNFPKGVCTSINGVIYHDIPDARPIENGDILNLDIKVYKNGNCIIKWA